ncbi:MAG: hypothetical protein ACI9R3_002547 [Verrucomicrobiales bacterium]|jgi:hypothetical protein
MQPMKNRYQFFAVLLAAFIAGIVTRSLWPSVKKPLVATMVRSTSPLTEQSISNPIEVNHRPPSLTKKSETKSGELLRITPKVIDAILSGVKISKRRLSQMDVTDDEIASIEKIQMIEMAAFKLIEKEHAEIVTDDRGSFIAISAFPYERRKWLEGMEARLRELLGDDSCCDRCTNDSVYGQR